MKKTILLTITAFMLTFTSIAQNVIFASNQFKQCLVGNALINTNSDGEIQINEATAFTGTIDCANDGITDMTGIEVFTSLTKLNCKYNSIDSLDLSLNIDLEEVRCNSNSLTFLNLDNLASLTTLYCEHNSLTDINFSQNSSLVTVYCEYNDLIDIDFSQNTSLISLMIHNNSLTTLNVANGNWYLTLNANTNPNLTCIQVDNVAYSTANWNNVPSTASFSTNCNPISVNSITVNGQGNVPNIIMPAGTLQMEAAVLPANADDATYTWSVDNVNATISTTGLLTAVANGAVIVTATANDNSGIIGTKTITISNQSGGGSVAINDLSFETLKVFPNPTTGIVNISVNETLTSLVLKDITGKQIKSFDSKATQLDVSDMSSGIYFLEVANESKNFIVKLIIR